MDSTTGERKGNNLLFAEAVRAFKIALEDWILSGSLGFSMSRGLGQRWGRLEIHLAAVLFNVLLRYCTAACVIAVELGVVLVFERSLTIIGCIYILVFRDKGIR